MCSRHSRPEVAQKLDDVLVTQSALLLSEKWRKLRLHVYLHGCRKERSTTTIPVETLSETNKHTYTMNLCTTEHVL